jgi:hypothetical protein
MLGVGLMDARPPFVRFEEREMGIDREQEKLTGRPVPRVVDLVLITSHGSKDQVEKLASEWLEQIKRQALAGLYPAAWVDTFSMQYREWKKGFDLPREGTPVRTWSAVTKEQQLRLHAGPYKTIEDLAAVPDTTLDTIGMDGRYLRDLAKTWLVEGKEKGLIARELADAKLALADTQAVLADVKSENASLRARLEALEQAVAAKSEPAPAGERPAPRSGRRGDSTATS